MTSPSPTQQFEPLSPFNLVCAELAGLLRGAPPVVHKGIEASLEASTSVLCGNRELLTLRETSDFSRPVVLRVEWNLQAQPPTPPMTQHSVHTDALGLVKGFIQHIKTSNSQNISR